MRAAEDKRLAEAVRRACLLAAEQATEDAGISGLCWEGRFEAALDAIRALRVDEGLISQPAAVSSQPSRRA